MGNINVNSINRSWPSYCTKPVADGASVLSSIDVIVAEVHKLINMLATISQKCYSYNYQLHITVSTTKTTRAIYS